MRIDKFLKMSRVIKRRSVANEVINLGRVSVNGKVVKPSYEVKVGDIVGVQFGDKISKFEILSIPKVQNVNLADVIKLI
ncbi:MAG: RNA-binding S4 domain-containing protein [Clostridia bacterium]|nr:RNA-binding S4 domain-containing protein [Clostridia bacterium]